ncbi:hypothetical protein L208DRAFT_1327401, partial [Tricholoma matsutake]
ILPEKYYKNFCKLVFGMHIIHQYQIDQVALLKAHAALLEFACEFKILYYQHCADRLHFV